MSTEEEQKKLKKRNDLAIKQAEMYLNHTRELAALQAIASAATAKVQECQKQHQLDLAKLNAGG